MTYRKLPRNGSSDIPQARVELRLAQQFGRMDQLTSQHIKRALSLMTRKEAIRRSSRKQKIKITRPVRLRIFQLSHTDMSMSEIARAVGLGSQAQGRVSEVLNGKR